MAKWNIPIELPGDPTLPLGATPKQYVDNGLALKAPLASPPLTGVPTAPTAAVDTTTSQLATTLYLANQAGTAVPLMNGTVSVGTSLRYARQDHVHPSDTSKLSASTYTAADVLAKLITVDGSTSGLDADLLDGQDGAYYLNLANLTGSFGSNLISTGDTVLGNTVGAVVTIGVIGGYTTFTASTAATTANQVLASIDASIYRSGEFRIQAYDAVNGRYHTATILALQNGATADWVEYGDIALGGRCADFSVDYQSGFLRLLVAPLSTSTISYKIVATLTKL